MVRVTSSLWVTLGFITFVIALLADLIGWNRKLIEVTLEKVRRLELALAPEISIEREPPLRGAVEEAHPADRERIAVKAKEQRR